jgi:hypothetical protein
MGDLIVPKAGISFPRSTVTQILFNIISSKISADTVLIVPFGSINIKWTADEVNWYVESTLNSYRCAELVNNHLKDFYVIQPLHRVCIT